MIEEAYCSYEVAKLLKEKGFNERLNTFYEWDPACDEEEDKEVIVSASYHCNSSFNPICCSAPTHQMAMKWLREIHNLQIQIAPINSKYKDWTFGIYKDFSPLTLDLICCPTYEEACEAAIKYCVENLIK